MQGLSPEHPEASEPLHTATPEGTPEDSPGLGEIPLVTLTHVHVSDVPEVFTPPPQVETTDPLAEFRITNTVEDYRFVMVNDLQDDFIFLKKLLLYLLNQLLGLLTV